MQLDTICSIIFLQAGYVFCFC